MSKGYVLVATQLESESQTVFERALQEASLCDCPVLVLFCYRLISQHGDQHLGVGLKNEIEKKAQMEFNRIQSSLANNDDRAIQFIMEIGFFSNRIQDHVQKQSVISIVLSNQLINHLRKVEEIDHQQWIKQLKVPVIIVPKAND